MELELASEGYQGAHEVGGAPRRGGAPSWIGRGPPGLHLWQGFFIIYSNIFHGVSGHSKNFCFLYINNTMVILLKTASVQVSSIQIMQVRVQNKGKTVWKSRYDGDVSVPTSVAFRTPSLPYKIPNIPKTLEVNLDQKFHCRKAL